MERVTLEAEPRDVGKGPSGRLRRRGLIPAIVYGGRDRTGVPIAVNQRHFQELLRTRGRNALIELRVRGEPETPPQTVMIRELQREPRHDQLLHIDFQRISLERKIRAEVPVVVLGEEELGRPDVVVQQLLRSIDVECLPRDIPEKIEVDVSDLEPGNQISVGDLVVPDGVEVLENPDEIVVTLLHGSAREEPEKGAEEGETEEEGESK